MEPMEGMPKHRLPSSRREFLAFCGSVSLIEWKFECWQHALELFEAERDVCGNVLL